MRRYLPAFDTMFYCISFVTSRYSLTCHYKTCVYARANDFQWAPDNWLALHAPRLALKLCWWIIDGAPTFTLSSRRGILNQHLSHGISVKVDSFDLDQPWWWTTAAEVWLFFKAICHVALFRWLHGQQWGLWGLKAHLNWATQRSLTTTFGNSFIKG